MGDGFYRLKDPTNSIKVPVLKEMLQSTNQTTKTTKYKYAQTIIYTKKDIHKKITSPPVYTNMRWLGDSSHRWQVRQAWTAVGLLPRYSHQSNTDNNNKSLSYAIHSLNGNSYLELFPRLKKHQPFLFLFTFLQRSACLPVDTSRPLNTCPIVYWQLKLSVAQPHLQQHPPVHCNDQTHR